MEKISSALDNYDYVGVLLSPNSVKSKWVQLELKTAMNLELCRDVVKVLPILVENCEIPIFIQDKVYADFRTEESYANGLRTLLERLLDISLVNSLKDEDVQTQRDSHSRVEIISALTPVACEIALSAHKEFGDRELIGIEHEDLLQIAIKYLIRSVDEFDARWPISLDEYCARRVRQAVNRELASWIRGSAEYLARKWDVERVGEYVRKAYFASNEKNDVEGKLHDVFMGLNRNERLILILYHMEGMTMQEVAATLDVSESRVSQMHSGILQRLHLQFRGKRKGAG